MSFTGRVPFRVPRAIQNTGGVNVATLAGNVTLTLASSTVQVLDPDGSNRNITLPAEEGGDGLSFAFRNSGSAGNLVIKNDAASTILTLNPGEDGEVACNGSAWTVVAQSAAALADFGASGIKTDVIAESTSGNGVAIDGLTIKDGDALLADSDAVKFGTGLDVTILWDGTDLLVSQAAPDSIIKWGVSGAGINHVFYGDTAGSDLTWDQTSDQLLFADNAKLAIGSGGGAAGDIQFYWDGTRMVVSQLTANSQIRWGADGAGIDHVFYGDTASATAAWDQSDDSLILTGVAKIKHQTIVAATGTAIPVTHSGSFPITQNGAETNTLADPTYLGQWLSIFVDTDTSGARVITAANRINQAGNTTITLTEVGDFIKLEAITIGGSLRWQVVANDGAVLS